MGAATLTASKSASLMLRPADLCSTGNGQVCPCMRAQGTLLLLVLRLVMALPLSQA